MISRYHPSYLTDGLWGKRPGIMFLARSDGFVIAYDICYKVNETIFSSKVTDFSITSMVLSKEGDKLFIADEEGKVSMLKLSKSFYEQTQVQKTTNQAFLNSMFDREVNKEKSIEILIERRKKKGAVKDDTVKLAKQEQQLKERLKQIEVDYMNFVNSAVKADPKEATGKVHEENKESSFREMSKKPSENKDVNQSLQNSSNLGTNREVLNQSQKEEQLDQSNKEEQLNQSGGGNLNQSVKEDSIVNSENLNISKKDNLNTSNLDNKSVNEEVKEDVKEEEKEGSKLEEAKEDVASQKGNDSNNLEDA
jgi:hypothetical protein